MTYHEINGFMDADSPFFTSAYRRSTGITTTSTWWRGRWIMIYYTFGCVPLQTNQAHFLPLPTPRPLKLPDLLSLSSSKRQRGSYLTPEGAETFIVELQQMTQNGEPLGCSSERLLFKFAVQMRKCAPSVEIPNSSIFFGKFCPASRSFQIIPNKSRETTCKV